MGEWLAQGGLFHLKRLHPIQGRQFALPGQKIRHAVLHRHRVPDQEGSLRGAAVGALHAAEQPAAGTPQPGRGPWRGS